jgi:hypothetical protein
MDDDVAVETLEKLIRLELIPPSQLTTSVAESGYFSYQRLYEALKFQSMVPALLPLTWDSKTSSHQYRRSLPIWKESKKLIAEATREDRHGVYALQEVAPFKSGSVCQWSIEVMTLCSHAWAWVGITTFPSIYDPELWLGMQCVGWVYGSDGAACHNEESATPTSYDIKFPEYAEGSLVTMTLDLRNDTGDVVDDDDETSGTLYASVDGGVPFLLFSGLCKALKENPAVEGFIPAVSLCKPGIMRLVDLKAPED